MMRLMNYQDHVITKFKNSLDHIVKVNLHEVFAEAGFFSKLEAWSCLALFFYLALYSVSKFVDLNLVKDPISITCVIVWCIYMLIIVPEMQMTYYKLNEQMHNIDELKTLMNDDDNIEGDFTELKNFEMDLEKNDKPRYNLDMNLSGNDRQDNEKWPQTGEIELNTVNIRYERIEDRALSNVSFKLKNAEKLAIIGPSLSGKTTLLNTLLRNVRIEIDDSNKTLGNIFIDWKNMESINLNKLRRNVFIIPQNPVLLNGNLIFNIDP